MGNLPDSRGKEFKRPVLVSYAVTAMFFWCFGYFIAVIYTGGGFFEELFDFRGALPPAIWSIPHFAISAMLAACYRDVVNTGKWRNRSQKLLVLQILFVVLLLAFERIERASWVGIASITHLSCLGIEQECLLALPPLLFSLLGFITCCSYCSSDHPKWKNLRFLLMWPAMVIVGGSILCGFTGYCAWNGVELIANPDSVKFSLVMLFCGSILCYLTIRFSVAEPPWCKALGSPRNLLKVCLFCLFGCLFLGETEPLVGIQICAFAGILETLVVVGDMPRRDKSGMPGKDDYKKLTYIAIIGMLLGSVIVLAFALPHPSKETNGIAAYLIIVTTGMIIALAHTVNTSFRKDSNRVIPTWVTKLLYLIAVAFLYLVVPCRFPEQVNNMAFFVENAQKMNALAVGLAGVFATVSITFMPQNKAGGNGGSTGFIEPMKKSIEAKLESYVKKTAFEDDVFHRTLAEFMAFCAIISLIAGNIFSAASSYFFLFALIISIGIFISFFYYYFFVRNR